MQGPTGRLIQMGLHIKTSSKKVQNQGAATYMERGTSSEERGEGSGERKDGAATYIWTTTVRWGEREGETGTTKRKRNTEACYVQKESRPPRIKAKSNPVRPCEAPLAGEIKVHHGGVDRRSAPSPVRPPLGGRPLARLEVVEGGKVHPVEGRQRLERRVGGRSFVERRV